MPLPAEVSDHVASLLDGADSRVLVGITGPPGAGKTTLARALVTDFIGRFGRAAVGYVPMDGFHLSDAVLERLGRRNRKGAPDTFDAAGFVALLHRIREMGHDICVPDFDHTAGEPISASLIVPAAARLVVVEGNYLGLDEPVWREVRQLLDRLVYVDADTAVRRERLRERHIAAGKTDADSLAWIGSVDEPNAALIATSRNRADLVVLND
ncbi:nucleoside/nucleotide kinase family protein [Gordonia aurantiaca]|uniref:nucleoside/nucleotide kinase family protein n=1 Tax=Gordonia sp. B21 TaxID=3151852 RepID=UPI0032662EEE